MSPTCTGSRKAISSSAAVTAGPPLCRCATAPAVESASFTISPPWMLPRRFASRADMTTPSETRPYDGGRARCRRATADVGRVGHARHGSVARMPDRPRNGGPEDGPDYNWLYGKGGKPRGPAGHPPGPAPAAAADAGSRRDPGDARPAAPDPAQRPHHPADPAPGRATARPAARRAGRQPVAKRRRFRVRYVFIVLLLWLVYLVDRCRSWPGRTSRRSSGSRTAQRPDDQPGTTYLLVGSDSRAGLSKEERKELSTGNAGGGRTDTIMLLHTGSGPNLLLSIPRDSIVDIPGHGTTKINAAYAFGGAPAAGARPSSRTPGSGSTSTSRSAWAGVAGLVDAVGGIEVCPKENMKDKLAGLNIKKGCQEVDGATALGVRALAARVRRSATSTGSARQREVVAAVGSAVLSPWTRPQPGPLLEAQPGDPRLLRLRRGHGPGPQRAVGDRDDPGQRRRRADLRGAVAGPGGELGPREGAGRCSRRSSRTTPTSIDKELCSATGGIG